MISETPDSLPNLLPLVAAGESRAMELCIERYSAIVWSIVRRHVKDVSDAEDLVQDIFTEVWKKSSSYDERISKETTFVGMIARRRSIDHLRKQGRQPEFATMEAAEAVPHPGSGSQPTQLDPESIRSQVAALPSETRELFHLFFDRGFTHPEIAEETGIPLGTVKTRLRRGLVALREQLQRLTQSNQPSAS